MTRPPLLSRLQESWNLAQHLFSNRKALFPSPHPIEKTLPPEDRHILRRLRNVGYFVMPGYLARVEAEELRRQVDAAIEARPRDVQIQDDSRMFGVEELSPEFLRFNQDRRFAAIAHAFLGNVKTVTTMANRLLAAPEARSSGGGWHRDRLRKQFKVLLYLTDVGPENGPFCLMERSKAFRNVVLDQFHTGGEPLQRRWSDEEMGRLLPHAKKRQHVFTASAGTAVLFDSSSIHRGLPIVTGERYALTNYYYEKLTKREHHKLVGKLKPLGKITRVPSFEDEYEDDTHE